LPNLYYSLCAFPLFLAFFPCPYPWFVVIFGRAFRVRVVLFQVSGTFCCFFLLLRASLFSFPRFVPLAAFFRIYPDKVWGKSRTLKHPPHQSWPLSTAPPLLWPRLTASLQGLFSSKALIFFPPTYFLRKMVVHYFPPLCAGFWVPPFAAAFLFLRV